MFRYGISMTLGSLDSSQFDSSATFLTNLLQPSLSGFLETLQFRRIDPFPIVLFLYWASQFNGF